MSVAKELDTSFNQLPLVDLRTYDASNLDRGRSSWYVMLWWLVQAIAINLSIDN